MEGLKRSQKSFTTLNFAYILYLTLKIWQIPSFLLCCCTHFCWLSQMSVKTSPCPACLLSQLSRARNEGYPKVESASPYRPQTCLTQKLVYKHVVSYKSCMKPGTSRICHWSNLLREVFPRYSQECQSKAYFRDRASKIDNFSMKIKSSA